MNSIRQIQELNKRELENGVTPEASWHADYRDTAYIYIGGLPFELSEGDVITIFSQFGEPTYINLVRDKDTGKSRGFAFLKYEDQRSTDLAVDNLGGAVVMGRTLRVDHTRYKKKDDEAETGIDLTQDLKLIAEGDEESRRKRRRTSESNSDEEERPMLKEEIELAKLIREHDEDDPMKQFLVDEKREEVALALARIKKDGKNASKSSSSHRHRHHHHHRSSRREKGEDDERRSSHRRREERQRRRSRSRDENEREKGKGVEDRDRGERDRERDRDRDRENRRRRVDSPGERNHRSRRNS